MYSNIRRTYKSKKETVGALDHKDVLLCMDQKSSVFDAFYIQNIKHTKKELSCVNASNHHGTAAKKVRKRKFVKRVVKDIESSTKVSPTKFTYLTPNKSFRVNKALDPFDMLLNSSPVCRPVHESAKGPGLPSNVNLKKYSRKRTKGKISHNYSTSSFSDSEKENCNESNDVQNTTDVISHKLLIESDSNKLNIINESIDKILLNLSKLKKGTMSPVFKTPLKFRRNRLTHNMNSPSLKTSPLCSTPFKEKYRGQSIYKFSPIIGRLSSSSSPNVSTISNEKHASKTVVSVEANVKSDINTQLIETNKSVKCNDTEKYDINKEWSKNHAITPLNLIKPINNNLTGNLCYDVDNSDVYIPSTEAKDKTEQNETFESINIIKDDKNHINESKIDMCSFETSEFEPLMGFTQSKMKETSAVEGRINEKLQRVLVKLVGNEKMGEYGNSSCSNCNKLDNSVQNNLYTCESENVVTNIINKLSSSMNYSHVDNGELASSDNTSSYDTCDSDSPDISIKNPIVLNDKLNNSLVFMCSKRAVSEISGISNGLQDNVKTPVVLMDKLSDSMVFKYSGKKLLTNVSKHSNEDNSCTLKEPVVLIDKLNDSLVFKLYEQIMSGDKSDSSVENSVTEQFSKNSDNEDISHLHNTSKNFDKDTQNVSNITEYINNSCDSDAQEGNTCKEFEIIDKSETSECKSSESFKSNNSYSNDSDISSQYPDDNDYTFKQSENDLESSDEGQCGSFVTTRTRHRAHNSLFMSMYSNSIESNSLSISTECEKTVLSNKISFEKDANYTINRPSLSTTNNENQNTQKLDKENPKKLTRRSSVKARNLRKSRLSNVEQQSLIKVDVHDSSDQTNDDSEDDTNVTLYKMAPNNKDNKFANFESLEISDNSNTDNVSKTKETSDSDVITITETDSDDVIAVNSKDMDLDKTRKSTISNSIETEEQDRVLEIIGHVNNPQTTSRYSQFNTQSLNTKKSLKYKRGSNAKSSIRFSTMDSETKQAIVLQPGKKWERSLSIYRRMSMMGDFNASGLDEGIERKGRKYRESVINTMEMQDCRGSLHNGTINSRSSFVSKPIRSTICIVKNPDSSRQSLSSTLGYEDLQGFLNDECDDTIIELSKLSLADANHEVTVLGLHEKPERGSTARDYVLRRCNQTETILFDECYPDTVLKNCHKIGEGVYGEVFLWRDRDGRARVMKIVPVAGTVKVNGENQKDFQEIISEIVIAMELSALRSPIAAIDRHFEDGKDVDTLDLRDLENATDVFNEVLAVRCVYGNYPLRLLDLWDLYDECKGSENDNPSELPVDQQYIVLELANAGLDLESYQFNNAEQAHALFLQVAFGLAVGEEAHQFEHRDLHWGNVLIAPTDQKYASFVLRGRCHRVPRCGVAATIIDYSLSRLSFPLGPAGDRAALYNDLSTDDALFDAVGDYQFEVYRLMRDKLGNDWKNFEPYTNILWLHYTVDKMITALRYKRVNTKIHKHYIDKLKSIKNRLLSYGSAVQFVLTDNEF